MPIRRALVTALLLAIWSTGQPQAARGQGYLRWDQAARPSALGGAASALAEDASAVFFSPASIVHLPGTRVQAGATLTSDEGRFRTFGGGAFGRARNPSFDGSLYVTHAIARRLSGGVAVNAPWGFAVEWLQPGRFTGRFRSTEGRLRSIQVNPVLAYGPVGAWSGAIGVDVLNAVFERTRFEQDPALSALLGGGPVGLARGRFETDGTAVGWNAALVARPSGRVSVGAQYRSRIEMDLSGRADFAVVAPAELRALPLPDGEGTVGELIDERYVLQNARTQLTFPRIVAFGAALRPLDGVLLALDAQWVGWGGVDTLGVAFADTSLSESVPLRYGDAWSVRGGLELAVGSRIDLRLGYAWVESPASLAGVTPLLPEADRDVYTAGAGFGWAGVGIDVAYGLTVFDDREGVAFPENSAAADGIYESVSHRVAVSLSRDL